MLIIEQILEWFNSCDTIKEKEFIIKELQNIIIDLNLIIAKEKINNLIKKNDD